MEKNLHNNSNKSFRKHFPIFSKDINGKPLVYLDNGATTQKPLQVIECMDNYYRCCNSNIHRGKYYLSRLGDQNVDAARMTCQQFINAVLPEEIIFTKGTTDGINSIATSFFETFIKPGDEIIATQMEHHSNLVPYQQLAKRYGAKIRFIPLTQVGELDMEFYQKILSSKTKLVAVVHASNSLGTINPIKEIINLAHSVGAKVIIDAAQSIAHLPIDVQDIDADFLVCSGHKAYGPQGIGFFYGKHSLLEEMKPYQWGGDMIKSVTMEETTFAGLPNKFEAGTPHIAGIIGLAEAIKFIMNLGFSAIIDHETDLLNYATSELLSIPGLKIYGTAKNKIGVVSFNIGNHHHNDIATLLSNYGISVRNGRHCTQPIMDYFNIHGTVRASFSCYNTIEDIDCLVDGLIKSIKIL